MHAFRTVIEEIVEGFVEGFFDEVLVSNAPAQKRKEVTRETHPM
jgi:hypothetical protein